MIINTDKTKGMLLTTHAKQSKLTDEDKDLNITMQGKQIKMHLKTCYLGLSLTVVFHGKLKCKRLDALFYSSYKS